MSLIVPDHIARIQEKWMGLSWSNLHYSAKNALLVTYLWHLRLICDNINKNLIYNLISIHDNLYKILHEVIWNLFLKFPFHTKLLPNFTGWFSAFLTVFMNNQEFLMQIFVCDANSFFFVQNHFFVKFNIVCEKAMCFYCFHCF